MGLPSSRFVPFCRLVLMPPLLLLTLTCLYTSSTLRPFNDKHRLSFSQDVQCFSCESSSLTASSFLSLSNFPASSYIRDVVLRHNVLNVEDSRGEKRSKPLSRRDTNELGSVRLKDTENVRGDVHLQRDLITGHEKHEVSNPTVHRKIIPEQESIDQKPVQRVSREEEDVARSQVGRSFSRGNDALVEGKIDNPEHSLGVKKSLDGGKKEEVFTDSSRAAEQKVDRSVSVVEVSTKMEENPGGRKEVEVVPSVPKDNAIDNTVQVVEGKVNVEREERKNVDVAGANEGFDGGRKEDLQVDNRHLTSDDESIPEVHAVATIPVNTSSIGKVSESPVEKQTPLPVKKTVMKFGYENMTTQYEVAAIAAQELMETVTKSALPQGKLVIDTDEEVNLLLRGGLPQGAPQSEWRSCEGRHVFVYDLPAKFNVELSTKCHNLVEWFDFCDYFGNEGMGSSVKTDELNDRGEKVLVPDGSWFLTHQYALELIFHARLKHYPCLTTDVNQADLFFVPYYAGLDVIRWHFLPNASDAERDELTGDLMIWLSGQETWSRNNGIDHVFVLGKIGWDFRRHNGDKGNWGNHLLNLQPMYNPTKVLIERHPWHGNDVGVPHPTFFHPKGDNEIWTWLAHVEKSERRYFVSFAGMPRPNMRENVRVHLIQQCLDHPDDCFLLRCEKTICMRPDSTMNLFLHSHFCMQPPGDSPTRRSVFDSLIGGCIPVLFDPYTAYLQYPWHLPQNTSSYSVFFPSPDVMSGKIDIMARLKSISAEERTAMRMRIIREIIPGLLYSQPGTKHSHFRDAFDISIEALLHRVANLRAEQNSL